MSYSNSWQLKESLSGEDSVKAMSDFNSIKSQVVFSLQFCGNALRHCYLESNPALWGYAFLLRDIVITYVVLSQLRAWLITVRGYGFINLVKMYWRETNKRVFRTMLTMPPLKKKVDEELNDTINEIELQLMKNDTNLLQCPQLPEEGVSAAKVLKEVENLQNLKHSDWLNGKVSGAVYHGGNELLDLQTASYHRNAVANQLHPDVFPGIRKMESEIVSMVLNLFNAPKSGCGSTTSGGTESLLLTGLAAREYGKKYKGITKPEVIAPITVHAGIDKACFYFGLKLHKVPIDPTSYQVDIKRVKKLINSNTVLLVGSAPNFPHGVIDDIEALSNLAVKYNIPLHVDACLGSFIVPFLGKPGIHDGIKVPLFDFRLPGVTSISCDTHKYGFAPKGSSVIMYRSKKLRECQYYVSSDWTGGMYGSPTLAGSRPGALMAGCWATMIYLGAEGYENSCREIVGTSMKFKNTIRNHELLSKHLEVIGEPLASVVAFKTKEQTHLQPTISIYELGDEMSKKGWHFSSLQNPAAVHFAFTRLTVPVIEDMIADLVMSVAYLVEKLESNKNQATVSQSQTSALYGVAGSIKTSSVADKIIVAFLDTLYKV